MGQETILIIEDDSDILELVQYNLKREGYKVVTAAQGDQGLALAQKLNPTLLVLDLMLPGIDGLTILRRLRADPQTADIPIVMLSAKGEESDIIVGLELGADDYVAKPFSPGELLARVRAVLRRQRGPVSTEPGLRRQVGPITLDTDRHEAWHHGAALTLTLAEFRLLEVLTSKPGRVFTREQLLSRISGGDVHVIDRNVDVHVRAIRKKLGDDAEFIMTVRGVGYKCRE